MMATTVPLTVYFDYTCPFAYRAHRWFDHLEDVDASWLPFSLLELNYRGDGPPVWRLPERADDISLLLFAGHSWVVADDRDLDRYRHDVFHAWHETDGGLDLDDVVEMASAAGATGGDGVAARSLLRRRSRPRHRPASRGVRLTNPGLRGGDRGVRQAWRTTGTRPRPPGSPGGQDDG